MSTNIMASGILEALPSTTKFFSIVQICIHTILKLFVIPWAIILII